MKRKKIQEIIEEYEERDTILTERIDQIEKHLIMWIIITIILLIIIIPTTIINIKQKYEINNKEKEIEKIEKEVQLYRNWITETEGLNWLFMGYYEKELNKKTFDLSKEVINEK